MSGRSGILGFGTILLLAGAATAWLFCGGGRAGLGGSGPDQAGGEESAAAAPKAGPTPPGTVRDGTAAIAGNVRRQGKAVPARIEVRGKPEPDYDLGYLASVLAEGEPIAEELAGEDGRFRVDRLSPGWFEVRAIGEGGIQAVAEAEIRARGQTVHVELDLPGGEHRIAGSAFWADGRPFTGVVSSDVAGAARAGPAGEFELRGLRPGRHRLFFCLEGKARYDGPFVVVPGAEDLRLTVDEGIEDTVGRILAAEDDAPVPGAEVLVSRTGAEVLSRTDEEGRFRARVGRQDRYVLVRAPGFAIAEAWPADGDQEVTIRLDRAGRIRGRVLAAEDGRPLPGVPVHLLRIEDDWISDRPPVTVTTVADGTFHFPQAPAGGVVLFVRGAGRATAGLAAAFSGEYNPHAVVVPPGGEVEVTLRAELSARIEGVVLDGDGRPLPGEEVRSAGLIPWGEADALAGVSVTDGAGRFEVADVPPESPWAVEAGRGLAVVRVAPLTGRPGETVPVEIRLPEDRWLEVLVLEDPSGQPLPGARVSLNTERGGNDRQDGETAEDGTCRIGPVSPTDTRVWVSHAECIGGYEGRWGAGGPPKTLEVRLRRGATIEGVFVGPDGEPVDSGQVRARLLDGSRRRGRWANAEVAADGTFRLSGLEEGRYDLQAWGEDGLSVSGITAESGERGVRLVGAGREGASRILEVRVLGPDGRPVPVAELNIVQVSPDSSDGDWEQVQDGRARVWLRSAATEIRLTVSRARSAAGLPVAAGAVTKTVLAGSATSVEIRLPAERRIAGRVVLPDGTPVPGVLVRAAPTDSENEDSGDGHGAARSGPDGAFSLGGLWDGAYTLFAVAGSEYDAGEALPARAGDLDVTIRLVRGRTFRLTVLDPRGDPVQGADVSAWWEIEKEDWSEDRQAEGTTDQRGVVDLAGLPDASPVSLSVSPPPSRRDLLSFSDGEWVPREGEVRLPGGLMVDGFVLDEAGVPAKDARVWARGEEGGWETTEIAIDGSFRAGPFPPGGVSLLALDRQDYDTDNRTPTVVTAGSRDVRLRYSAGWTLDVTIADPPRGVRLPNAWVSEIGGGEERWYWVGSDARLFLENRKASSRYDVYVGPVGAGAYALARNVGKETGPVRISLTGGRRVTIRPKVPADASVESVRVDGEGFRVVAGAAGEGAWVATGIPPGPLSVAVGVRREDGVRLQVYEVREGDSCEPDLAVDGAGR